MISHSFETRGVRSAALYPLKLNDKFTGFISFEGCSREIKWSTSQTELMMTISGMVSSFDCRLYKKHKIRER
ncbi:MAG: GAF domain-containing protein [Bacteroidales bacterium]|nr:GAF domain-containing protein [Bacteroidales bacterium]